MLRHYIIYEVTIIRALKNEKKKIANNLKLVETSQDEPKPAGGKGLFHSDVIRTSGWGIRCLSVSSR